MLPAPAAALAPLKSSISDFLDDEVDTVKDAAGAYALPSPCALCVRVYVSSLALV
jgi:hypothetical protein